MTIVNGYCTLAELKAAPALNLSSSTANDAFYENVITAISRSIDMQCARYFYKSTADETRFFTPRSYIHVFVGDMVSLSSLYTDTASGDRTYPHQWSATDYDLYPYDAAQISEPEPYRWIDRTPRGTFFFDKNVPKSVKVTGIFGWSAVPAAISKMCLLWAERMVKRFDTPLGVSASTALGEMQVKVPPPDPDVEAVLSNYRVVSV